jgi:hypothetical protein
MASKSTRTHFKRDYKEEVEAELKDSRELYALFLIHDFIGGYLREWLYITGKASKEAITKDRIIEIEKIRFREIILVHLALGNIPYRLFTDLASLNKIRNNFAHHLTQIDYKNPKEKFKLKTAAQWGIALCDEVYSLYFKKLVERSRHV